MRAALAVRKTGTGDPLVLLHGIATDSRIWTTVVPRLVRERAVVTVDLPGFGASDPVGEGFELDRVAARVARGLAANGIHDGFDLVGHSLGGGVAIALAALMPNSVRRLMLVAPAGLRPLPPSVGTLLGTERVANLVSSGADAFLAARRSAAALADMAWGRRLLLALTAADGSDVPPAIARGMLEASLSARRTGPALATITTTDLRPRLAATRMPLGAIWGEADLTVPIRALDDLMVARPDALVVRLADTGHVPMVERPDAFVRALERLLNNETNPSAGEPMLA
ncbi:MAG: alpha/beta fold hydrolase [Solirubrobacterales bacterium]|nr:alpha/beta fold hydrolase [Solirubrobacterales bacterium]